MRTRRMRRVSALVAGLVLWIGPRVASAQLATVETGSLRLVYFDGSESYLVPHAARTFFNSLAFQRKLFGFEPGEPITVLLADFADYGNAGASVGAPRHADRPDRAAQLRVRDDRRERADEHHHEPRAGARGDDGPGGGAGPGVPRGCSAAR